MCINNEIYQLYEENITELKSLKSALIRWQGFRTHAGRPVVGKSISPGTGGSPPFIKLQQAYDYSLLQDTFRRNRFNWTGIWWAQFDGQNDQGWVVFQSHHSDYHQLIGDEKNQQKIYFTYFEQVDARRERGLDFLVLIEIVLETKCWIIDLHLSKAE